MKQQTIKENRKAEQRYNLLFQSFISNSEECVCHYVMNKHTISRKGKNEA